MKNHSSEIAVKVKKLLDLKTEYYTRVAPQMNPKAAASYAVQDIMNQYKSQQQFLGSLLDQEIEDAEKALK